MKSTRERILQTLLTHPNSTIYDLAAAVDINAVSVRHHLSSLQAEDLIEAAEERHGVGRPRLVYSLTERGAELFPTRYVKLVSHLLRELKHALSEKELQRLLTNIAIDISGKHAAKIHGLSLESKLDSIVDFLASEGILIEWEKKDSEFIITEIACPFYHISQQYPEVCTIDQAIFSTLIATPVRKVKCILSGDPHCAYVIQQTETKER